MRTVREGIRGVCALVFLLRVDGTSLAQVLASVLERDGGLTQKQTALASER